MWYERCSAEMDQIADALAALGTAIDVHQRTLEQFEGSITDSADPEFLAWLRGQRKRLDGLQTVVDDEAHDLLLRVADRVIRIKHWEDGEFV